MKVAKKEIIGSCRNQGMKKFFFIFGGNQGMGESLQNTIESREIKRF